MLFCQLLDLLQAARADSQLLLDEAMALALNEVLNDLSIHETPPSQLLPSALPLGESGQDSDQPGAFPIRWENAGPSDPDSVGKRGQVTPIRRKNGVS